MNLPFNVPKMDLAYGTVREVGHPDGDFQVKISLHAMRDTEGQDYSLWARVMQPVAGDGYGTVMMPDVGDEVIVGFVSGDMNRPVVLGSLYHGNARPAEEPVAGGGVRRWSMTGHDGTRVSIDESGSPTVTLETPGGVSVVVTDDGTKATVTNGSETVELTPGSVSVQTGGRVEVEASTVQVTAGQVTIDAAVTRCSGIVMCDVLQTNTVIATTYTPGAGNIW